MLQTVDNYFPFGKDTKKYYFIFNGSKSQIKKDKKVISNKLEINLSDYQNKKYSNNKIFSFLKDEDNKDLKNQDDLIISISKSNEDNYIAQSGNYIGKFDWNGLEINIKSRFSDVFLTRILNFANDIFLDDVNVLGKESKNDLDYSKFIIYYMFIQKLEKAFLLGFPKSYISVNYHEMKVKGKIDINRFIKNDIPFKGKISSTSREQKEIQEIIDVLYKAITIIEKNKFDTKNISHIKTHLKQHRSNRYVSNQTISKAIKSKALQNPIFAPYKKVLEYAKLIIDANNLEEKKDGDKETFGFLVNIAELFEVYLVKLLQLRMPDWEVIHEEQLEIYKNNFFRRNMYPDIVMKKGNKIMVFDAKYKKMTFKNRYENGGDLDRNDFFQINTYMTYYDKQENLEVIAGGLLYPMESNIEKSNAHADNWFGDTKTKFIVDGIDLSESDLTIEDILKSEDDFIERIKLNNKY